MENDTVVCLTPTSLPVEEETLWSLSDLLTDDEPAVEFVHQCLPGAEAAVLSILRACFAPNTIEIQPLSRFFGFFNLLLRDGREKNCVFVFLDGVLFWFYKRVHVLAEAS